MMKVNLEELRAQLFGLPEPASYCPLLDPLDFRHLLWAGGSTYFSC